MKIKYVNFNKKKLKNLKKVIDILLDLSESEVDFTEDNIKRAIEIKTLVNNIKQEARFDSDTYIKIVSSDGTELTVI